MAVASLTCRALSTHDIHWKDERGRRHCLATLQIIHSPCRPARNVNPPRTHPLVKRYSVGLLFVQR